MKLSGNKVLITGATSGIGHALLLEFLKHDNQVIAVGRSEEKLRKLSKLDNRITPYVCDLRNDVELKELTNYLSDEHHDLNILINCASVHYQYHLLNGANVQAKIDEEIAVNLTVPIKLAHRLLPVLRFNDEAAIVNVSSGLALVPNLSAPVHCGTKAALHTFTKSLRHQLHTIKVFELIPPVVETDDMKGGGFSKISPEQLAEEFMTAFKKNQYEINIGKVKLLKWINRISPVVADSIMKREL